MLSYSLAWPFGERVSESAARAPLAPERLPPRLAARLVGKQPILTFVTAGELARWTKLRHWGPGNLAMPGSWLCRQAGHPRQQGHRGCLGRSVSRGHPERAASPGQRHLGCCLLPCLPAAAGHLQSQGFQGLRRVPRVAAARAVACNTLTHRGQRAGSAAAGQQPRLPGCSGAGTLVAAGAFTRGRARDEAASFRGHSGRLGEHG